MFKKQNLPAYFYIFDPEQLYETHQSYNSRINSFCLRSNS